MDLLLRGESPVFFRADEMPHHSIRLRPAVLMEERGFSPIYSVCVGEVRVMNDLEYVSR